MWTIKLFQLVGLFLIVISVVLGMESSSVVTVWLCLELNLFSFILWMLGDTSKNEVVKLHYFLVQSFGSLVFILSWVGDMFSLNPGVGSSLMLVSLCIKAAIPPFHGWLISVCKEINVSGFIVLNTIQKVLPVYFLIKFNSYLLVLMAMISFATSLYGMLMSKRVSDFFTHSSVLTTSWMILAIGKFSLGILYLLFYSMGLYVLFYCLLVSFHSTLGSNYFKTAVVGSSMISVVMVFYLMGLPPFAPFFLKMKILTGLLELHFLEISLAILLLTPVSMWCYVKNFITNTNLAKQAPLSNLSFSLSLVGVDSLFIMVSLFSVLFLFI